MAVASRASAPLQDIAPDGFSRWKIPLAALLVHFSIGQVYSFSVFNKPLGKLVGLTAPVAGDWSPELIGWIFSLAIATLGLTAAFAGPTLERLGPRKTLALCALFFASGFGIAALGIHLHQFWVVLMGYGVLGGMGLGLGYATPVSVLMRWFPDRPGLAAGMAIMGFGGGAMIGAPLAVRLISSFSTSTDAGVWPTLAVMGAIYGIAIATGAWLIRNPSASFMAAHTQGPRKEQPAQATQISGTGTPLNDTLKTPTFYLLWSLFFLNILAGLSVISNAASMVAELFPASGIGMATLFVTLLSIGNMLGRLGWATLSDKLGRKATFGTFFMLGMLLYGLLPMVGILSVWGYMALNIVLISMYGGGFSTMPVYVKDCFGMTHLGPLYGRMLTAWSAAAVLGHMLVAHVTAWQLAHGFSRLATYQNTMLMMSGVMAVAFLLNMMIRPKPTA